LSDPADIEKRRHLRRAAQVAIELWLQSELEEPPLIEAVATDVSTGGLSVRGKCQDAEAIDETVAKAAPMATRFELPNQARPVQAIVRPRWVVRGDEPGSFDMGLQFEEITSACRDALVSFVLRDLGLQEGQEGQADMPIMERVQGIDDLATRIEGKMREIDALLSSVVAGRTVLLEEVASLRQILLRLCQRP